MFVGIPDCLCFRGDGDGGKSLRPMLVRVLLPTASPERLHDSVVHDWGGGGVRGHPEEGHFLVLVDNMNFIPFLLCTLRTSACAEVGKGARAVEGSCRRWSDV